MIGFLEGELKSILDDGTIIVLSNGVGWSVNAVSTNALNVGEQISLFIHTSVREDDISLWGFSTSNEVSLFRQLLSVSGVGARTAALMISTLGHDALVSAIFSGDATKVKVKGVGPKTAQKIILDLKDKVDITKVSGDIKPEIKENRNINEATDALIALGYKERDIKESISKLAKMDNIDILPLSEQEIIKLLLTKL